VGGAAGGIVGSLTGAGVPEHDANFYAEGVRRVKTCAVERQTGRVRAADLTVICVETLHMKALPKAQQINKTDRNDAPRTAQTIPGYSPPTSPPPLAP
jgi:hypothetical protein